MTVHIRGFSSLGASIPILRGRSLRPVKNSGDPGESLEFMPPDALILAQNAPKTRLAAGLRPDPLGSLQRAPP